MSPNDNGASQSAARAGMGSRDAMEAVQDMAEDLSSVPGEQGQQKDSVVSSILSVLYSCTFNVDFMKSHLRRLSDCRRTSKRLES